jgi:transposase
MHMIGYFEGIDSERGVAWRSADSFSLRDFLRLSPSASASRDSSRRCRAARSCAMPRWPPSSSRRAFAHVLDRDGMRRAWLRGRENVHKRYLIHVAGFNLGVLTRALYGQGTPREAAEAVYALIFLLHADAALVSASSVERTPTSLSF